MNSSDASDLSSWRKAALSLAMGVRIWSPLAVISHLDGRERAGPFLTLAGRPADHRWPRLLMQPGNDDAVTSKVTVRRHRSARVFRAQSSDSDGTCRLRLCDNRRKTRARREQVINYTRTKAMQMGTELIRERPGSPDDKKKAFGHVDNIYWVCPGRGTADSVTLL